MQDFSQHVALLRSLMLFVTVSGCSLHCFHSEGRKEASPFYDNVRKATVVQVSNSSKEDLIVLPADIQWPDLFSTTLYVRHFYADCWETIMAEGKSSNAALRRFIVVGTRTFESLMLTFILRWFGCCLAGYGNWSSDCCTVGSWHRQIVVWTLCPVPCVNGRTYCCLPRAQGWVHIPVPEWCRAQERRSRCFQCPSCKPTHGVHSGW